MSDETTLLPCPFCGGEAKIMNLNHGTWVECSNYHYERHQVCVHAKTEAEAIAAWNSRAELESGTCELVYGENDYGDDGWWCQSCGEWFAASFRHTGRNNIIKPSYCQHCGKSVKR